jgi:hypothetical protein
MSAKLTVPAAFRDTRQRPRYPTDASAGSNSPHTMAAPFARTGTVTSPMGLPLLVSCTSGVRVKPSPSPLMRPVWDSPVRRGRVRQLPGGSGIASAPGEHEERGAVAASCHGVGGAWRHESLREPSAGAVHQRHGRRGHV